MFARTVLVVVVLSAFAVGCARSDGPQPVAARAGNAPGQVAPTGLPDTIARRGGVLGFASLPDRGDLLAYPGKVVREDGAYTWYRADLSEEHALHAIADGRLRVTTPEGEVLDFSYDRHIEHPSGDWTWIGHRPEHEGEQTILTFGAGAAFGSIARPGKSPLRLTMRDGVGWLVETDPVKLAGIVNAATRPQRPDYHIVPESELPRRTTGVAAAADGATTSPHSAGATSLAATTTTTTTVDLLIGYTKGFATANGGATNAMTRLNYLVDTANAAYGNSKVTGRVRLVKAMQVNYTDTNSNDTALEQLSGYKSGSGPVTPSAAFNALRAARDQYGADLVSLVRDFRDPEQDGCGLAWLLGGSLQKIGQGEGWDELAYSVVGDGVDQGSDGKSYYCQDSTLAHEMGHNMGAAHDRETAKGGDGVLNNPDDYGAYAYSFGYKTGVAAGNFYTVMAYGDSGQVEYLVFSNPAIKYCGGRYCGVADKADNARNLRQTMPIVATFRSAQVAAKERVLLKQVDTNGDRRYDLLFFNHALGKLTTWFMRGSTRLAYSSSAASGSLRLVDTGDFDGNGRTDLLFDDSSARVLTMALSTGSSYTQYTLANVYSTGTLPMGVADVNGDGKSDILLRNTSTGRVTIWYMSGTTRIAYNGYDIPATWEFVGSGDLNGDHKQDLLWTNADRQLLLSMSVGTAFDTQMLPLAYQSTYDVAGLQDINGDGRSDILLPSVDGTRLVVWYMNGPTRIAYNSHAVDPAYMLVGKGDFDGNRFGDLVMTNRETRQIKLLQSSGMAFSTSLLGIVPQSGSLLMDVE